jgi:hypothetical protein
MSFFQQTLKQLPFKVFLTLFSTLKRTVPRKIRYTTPYVKFSGEREE